MSGTQRGGGQGRFWGNGKGNRGGRHKSPGSRHSRNSAADPCRLRISVQDDGSVKVTIALNDIPALQTGAEIAAKGKEAREEGKGKKAERPAKMTAYAKAKDEAQASITRCDQFDGNKGTELVDALKRLVRVLKLSADEAERILISKQAEMQKLLHLEEESKDKNQDSVVQLCAECVEIVSEMRELQLAALTCTDHMLPKQQNLVMELILRCREWEGSFSAEQSKELRPVWLEEITETKGQTAPLHPCAQALVRSMKPVVDGAGGAGAVSPQLKRQRSEVVSYLRDTVVRFCEHAGFERASLHLFGSIAAGLDTPSSDIDLMLKVEGSIPEQYARIQGQPSAIRNKCWTCGQANHISRNCPMRNGGVAPPAPAESSAAASSKGQQGKPSSSPQGPPEEGKDDNEDEEQRNDEDDEEGGGADEEEEEDAEGEDVIVDKQHLLRNINKALKKGGRRLDTQPILHARVPLIKIRDLATNFQLDISMENDLSLHKAALLSVYVQVDERFPRLLQLVKHWAKARRINDAAAQTLNSFGYTLLVIQFLQNCKPPILPSLHADTIEVEGTTLVRPPAIETINSIEIRFHGQPPEGLPPILKHFGRANRTPVHRLFVEFLHFLAVEFDVDAHCVSVRAGCLQPIDRQQFKHKHPPKLCVEDPFDRADNVARSLTEDSIKRVRLEFLRAYRIMSTKGDFRQCCEPYMAAGGGGGGRGGGMHGPAVGGWAGGRGPGGRAQPQSQAQQQQSQQYQHQLHQQQQNQTLQAKQAAAAAAHRAQQHAMQQHMLQAQLLMQQQQQQQQQQFGGYAAMGYGRGGAGPGQRAGLRGRAGRGRGWTQGPTSRGDVTRPDLHAAAEQQAAAQQMAMQAQLAQQQQHGQQHGQQQGRQQQQQHGQKQKQVPRAKPVKEKGDNAAKVCYP